MSRKRKLIIFSALTLAILVLAALIPVHFLNNDAVEKSDKQLRVSQRADLFDLYWREASGGYDFSALDLDNEAELSQSRQKIDGLLADMVMDEAKGIVSSEGNEFFELTDHEGKTMRIWHSWSEWSGEWKNWFDVYIDIDSLDIYYLYLSSECLVKPRSYVPEPFPYSDAMNAAGHWQSVCGYELIGVSWSGEPTETAASIYLFDNDAIHYGINCIYHPGILFDLRILING